MSTVTVEAAPVIARRHQPKESTLSPQVVIGLGVALLAWGPLLYTYGTNLWALSHYEFFPLVLAGSALLAWNASKRLGPLEPGKHKIFVWIGGLISVALLAAGVLVNSPLAAVVSLLIGLLAFLYGYGGWTLLWRMLPAWAFLILAVRLPFGLDLKFINYLQTITTRWSSYFLDLFGVIHLMNGNVVEVPGKQLMVEQACSGINSLFAILTCSIFFVFWSRRGIVHAILLIAGGIGWVLVGNLIRVTVIAVAFTKRGIDLSEGWKHEALGFAIFFLLLVLTWSLDRLLLFVIATVNSVLLWRRTALARQLELKQAQLRKVDLGATRWPDLSKGWIFAKPAILGLALVACLNGALIASGVFDTTPLSADKMVAVFGQLGAEQLKGEINGWQMIKFEAEQRKNGDIHGDYSRTWTFKKGDNQCVLSLDYAWTIFHDLQVCYNATGWTVSSRQEHVLSPAPGSSVPDHVIEISMNKPLGHNGYLLFTEYEADGVAADLPGTQVDSLKRRLMRLSLKPPRKLLIYQVQLFADALRPPTEELKKEYRALFDRVRSGIATAAPHKGEVAR